MSDCFRIISTKSSYGTYCVGSRFGLSKSDGLAMESADDNLLSKKLLPRDRVLDWCGLDGSLDSAMETMLSWVWAFLRKPNVKFFSFCKVKARLLCYWVYGIYNKSLVPTVDLLADFVSSEFNVGSTCESSW
jgi:hypothetical protein